jgi:hypothetical protein
LKGSNAEPVHAKICALRADLAANLIDPRRLFDACGFEVVGNPDGGKQRVRRRIM